MRELFLTILSFFLVMKIAFSDTTVCGPYTVTYTVNQVNNCNSSNGSVTITSVVGGTGPYTYNWNTISGQSSIVNQAGNTITTVKSGVYNVEVTGSLGTCNFNIRVSTGSIGVPSASDATLCSNTSTTLTASGCVNGYVWTLSDGTTQVSTLSSYVTPTLTMSTTYIVFCTSSGNSCASTGDNVTVNVVAPPTATPSNLGNIDVAAGTIVTVPVGLTITPAGSYTWTDDGVNSVTPATGDLTPDYTTADGDKGKTVTLTAIATNSPCPSATAIYTINVRTKLPIDLQEFNGISEGCTNKLNWKISNAKNFKQFELLVSKNAKDFNTISIILAFPQNGFTDNNYLNREYSYNDLYLTPGNYYYKLKMVDLDERFEYSKMIFVKSSCLEPSAFVYPNPILKSKVVEVQLANFGDIIRENLIDITGRVLQTQILKNGTNTIDLAHIQSGVYWLTIHDSDKKEKILKLAITQ